MSLADSLPTLLNDAKAASLSAYAPYSNFRVGAAFLCKDGSVITGFNVENRSYGLTVCAERVALFTALSLGKKDFLALAVYCSDADYPVSPCGACRQVLSEFLPPEFPVLFSGSKGEPIQASLKELFPYDGLHELKKRASGPRLL